MKSDLALAKLPNMRTEDSSNAASWVRCAQRGLLRPLFNQIVSAAQVPCILPTQRWTMDKEHVKGVADDCRVTRPMDFLRRGMSFWI
jgi:hypothetical protein